MARGGRQAERAQEAGQRDKARKDRQDSGAYEEDVRGYRARERRVVTEESDDGGALRAQQVWEGRKPVDKGKYHQLNRLGPSNHNMNEEGDTTPLPKEKPQTPR